MKGRLDDEMRLMRSANGMVDAVTWKGSVLMMNVYFDVGVVCAVGPNV